MPSIFFIHGFATGPEIWKEQFREFSSEYTVITDDRSVGSREDVYVIGWSMGAWRAIELYLEYPKKVRGLILVSAFAKYLKSEDYPYGTSPALLKKLEKRIKADNKSGLLYFYSLVSKDNAWHSLIDRSPAPDKADIDRWFDKLEKEDKRRDLPMIKVPVLLIHGDQDLISAPENSRYLYDKLPDAQLKIFKGVGHAPFFERRDEFNACLREFLRRNEN